MSDTSAEPSRSWQEITAEASRETDPKRLAELSEELVRALAERDARLKRSSGAA